MVYAGRPRLDNHRYITLPAPSHVAPQANSETVLKAPSRALVLYVLSNHELTFAAVLTTTSYISNMITQSMYD